MVERDDTDELPRVPPPAPPPDRTERVQADEPATARIPADDQRTRPVEAPSRRRGGAGPSSREDRRGRFGPARRRAVMWNAGHGMVSGLVLLVLWAADRPVDAVPDLASLAVGIAFVLWAGILAAIAAGGVGRAATALIAVLNLLVGGAVLATGWLTVTVPTLVVVVAAQVVGIGVVQLLATVRR